MDSTEQVRSARTKEATMQTTTHVNAGQGAVIYYGG